MIKYEAISGKDFDLMTRFKWLDNLDCSTDFNKECTVYCEILDEVVSYNSVEIYKNDYSIIFIYNLTENPYVVESEGLHSVGLKKPTIYIVEYIL